MIRVSCLLVAAVVAASSTRAAVPPNLPNTVPTWSEEFTYGLAPNMWDRGLSPWPNTIANRILPGTGEQQIYVDPAYLGAETSFASTGTYFLTARRMDTPTRVRILSRLSEERPSSWHAAAIRKANWISAVIKSRKTFQYGYVEASIRWDPTDESWPAFWLLPSQWITPPEIDIVEMKMENGVPTAVMGIHSRQGGWVNKSCRIPIPNGGRGFHRYGFRWNATTSTFYLDGKVSCVMPTPIDLHQPFYPIVNLAMGGWGQKPSAATREPQTVQIDYIRYWAE